LSIHRTVKWKHHGGDRSYRFQAFSQAFSLPQTSLKFAKISSQFLLVNSAIAFSGFLGIGGGRRGIPNQEGGC